MSELRYNPLLQTYTMVAANRQNRPHLPHNNCPFCPQSKQVPPNFDVLVYNNDFPVLSHSPPPLQPYNNQVYHNAVAYGKCEVILYSPNHQARLQDLSIPHLTKLVQVWAQRCEVYAADPQIKYAYIFENKGEEVGVTMHHPHGQIYGYPFVPLKIKTELDSCKQHYNKHKKCLLCNILEVEQAEKSRLIFENEHFNVFLPYFTDYPFGVFIVLKQHKCNLLEFTAQEQMLLAETLKKTVGMFDCLYDKAFPYMMCMHQTPYNCRNYSTKNSYYHWHIEFYPPLRSADKIKFYASSEMGAWAAANVIQVEEAAVLLRKALTKFEAI